MLMRTWISIVVLSALKITTFSYEITPQQRNGESDGVVYEHPGGIVTSRLVFERKQSPYVLKNDLIVDHNAELIIESGVEVRVEPQIGITVRGILTAAGSENNRILLTAARELKEVTPEPDIRLIDGPSPLAGRVQIRHNGKWRSVCTNSKNWTLADMGVACRQLGYQGGGFQSWQNREYPSKPRLLYEAPYCRGSESSLFECDWHTRQLGSGVCEYHPDLAVACDPLHDVASSHWRGIRFENAKFDRVLGVGNTLYVPTSLSRLEFVSIKYAGNGRDCNASSGVEVIGVAPIIRDVHVEDSAFGGLNISQSVGPTVISNSRIRGCKGIGIFVNTSYGDVLIDKSLITENGEGIKYVRFDNRPDDFFDKNDKSDFCTSATAASQIYPLEMYADQTIYNLKRKECAETFTTRYGYRLTLHFLRVRMEKNETARIEVWENTKLLNAFYLRNNTRPESISTFGNRISIKFIAEPQNEMFIYMRLVSGLERSVDLNVSRSDVSDNSGKGVYVENLRTGLHIYKSGISKNTIGVHVNTGVGDVNITESRISFNTEDGVNITYTGGNRNISRSSISSNGNYGISVWLNESITEYIYNNQSTVIEYSELIKNLQTGILHGNFCNVHYINITGNTFKESLGDALEILTCWKGNEFNSSGNTKLQIGHNIFQKNHKFSIKISPVLNLYGFIEFNDIKENYFAALLLKNQPLEEFNFLKSHILIQDNRFTKNTGRFIVNLALSPYSEYQSILFTKNRIKDNIVQEHFDGENFNPRSRVSAVLTIGSSNVKIYRNIIENPLSKYEIGAWLEDQSQIINATFNWLGSSSEADIYKKIFHRNDRYNLAKIIYVPYLLHNSHFLTERINPYSTYVPFFINKDSNLIGGEVEGEEMLSKGEYIVEKDINVRPGGKLILEAGVILKFPTCIGVLIGGKLEAKGNEPDSIKFTLKEEIKYEIENTTEHANEEIEEEFEGIEESTIDDSVIRLLGGDKTNYGRLQIKINETWGTVCNYNWNILNAAVACRQLGMVLNPEDWFLEAGEIPNAGSNEPIVLSNLRCDEFDVDLRNCRGEHVGDFENSCSHQNDVGLRCFDTSWAGVRFGALAERSDLQFITIEKAGLLDYSTNVFKAALQIDFSRHNFESIKLQNNYHDGLSIYYSDLYSEDNINNVRNSEFINNRAGVSFKQLGLKISNSKISGNIFGIQHDPQISFLAQRELTGMFFEGHGTNFKIPHELDQNVIHLDRGVAKTLITSKIFGDSVRRSYRFKCEPGYVIGIQLLNPIHNKSTENMLVFDSQNYNNQSKIFVLKRDLNSFPMSSSSHGIILNYESGNGASGGVILILTAVRAPYQNIPNRIVSGAIPTVNIINSDIKSNKYGIHVSSYNKYLNELGDHYLRKANETLKLLNCDISHNSAEAFYFHSPHWDLSKSNLSEITLMVNNSLITSNRRGFYHFSRDMRSSNNLYHYILQDVTYENNNAGFEINLPYVWDYNENFTHSFYINNNTMRNNKNFNILIDGHYSSINITRSSFQKNNCKVSLITFKGMEKKFLINSNDFNMNYAKHLIQFNLDSQSEIMGEIPARLIYNNFKNNKISLTINRLYQKSELPTSIISFNGIQKVNINRNLFANNNQRYQLIAGIKTAKLNNELNAKENYWGATIVSDIRNVIFDFDDWNNHAIALYKPYLTEDNFDASFSSEYTDETPMDINNLGGRLNQDLILTQRDKPYLIHSDLTVMPKVTLTLEAGVVLEFKANIGVLVLGKLEAKGFKDGEIIMRAYKNDNQNNKEEMNYYENFEKIRNVRNVQMYETTNRAESNEYNSELDSLKESSSIRLCKTLECQKQSNEGFLEYFNSTTLQWVPMCDPRFTERNAEVVCRELNYNTLNIFFSRDKRYEYHSNSLSRIWSWPEPLQCSGEESKYEDCPIRLNGQQYGHRHECKWNDDFVFVHCAKTPSKIYWGGIRFANPEFESQLYEHRYHSAHTHTVTTHEESSLTFVKIIDAGILHNEKSPAVQSITQSPKISYVTVLDSASHGINIISPAKTLNLHGNQIERSLGIGINILSLTGEGREAEESSFTPIKNPALPYNLFSLIDICDTSKVVRIEEKVILYYKYDNHPVNCVKIFKSSYNIKPFGFRLLHFNLFNSSSNYGIADYISLYDGDIYNVTSKLIGKIDMKSGNEKKLFKTKESSLSIKLFANGASGSHGFIAEVLTLPISAIGFNRDVQHNVTSSTISRNKEGGFVYVSAGEVNPVITIDKNRFKNNCEKLYGNFTTCKGAVDIDVQNTQTLYFRNNLVDSNQGGLSIKADSRSSATSLKAYIHNNLFVNNTNLPALYAEGRQSSPYQDVTIYRNYFTRNWAEYENNIVLKQVVSNFTFNYVKRNVGKQNLEVSGFDKVRLPIYQTTSHNGFYNNYAVHRDSRSTIVAGTAGQHYVDNIFFNPDNDYEMITVNHSLFNFNSTLEVWKTKIDAAYNYWGFNTTLAVSSRIRDQYDDARLLEVNYENYYMNNETVLNGKCPPGWDLVGDTCYIYIGAPMTFDEAKSFCQTDNASMPVLIGNLNYYALYDFLIRQQQWYLYSDKVWVQHIDKINTCTAFVYQSVETEYCDRLYPFICEIDPKVYIDPLVWRGDVLTISAIIACIIGVLLIGLVLICWWNKSKYRHAQRLERRNSIRQSLHSLRSVGSTHAFSELGYRRKPGQLSTRSTDTLTKNTDYKKMVSNGSIDSMEKSTYNSSIEDTHSYDIYETHNPNSSFSYNTTIEHHKRPSPTSTYDPQYAQPSYAQPLAYRNEGFKDNSTFASNSQVPSVSEASTPQESKRTDRFNYHNTDTLPLNQNNFIEELKSKRKPIMETNFDEFENEKTLHHKSKSEALLETSFDFDLEEPVLNNPIGEYARSKSQPLETAM